MPLRSSATVAFYPSVSAKSQHKNRLLGHVVLTHPPHSLTAYSPFAFPRFGLVTPSATTSFTSFPLTTEYSHVSATVESAIMSAEPAKRPIRWEVDRRSKIWGAYDEHISQTAFPCIGTHRVGVEGIELIASFNPEPIAKSYNSAEPEGGEKGYRPGRGKEEQVECEGNGGYGMKRQICFECQRGRPVR